MSDHFTPEQIAEIREMAEARDLDRARYSLLSRGEHDELSLRDELQGRPAFSRQQLAELDRRADERDWLRQRQSRFSDVEQGELDETARNLDFNERQQADLTHRFNKVEESALTRTAKRFWPFVMGALIVILLIIILAAQHTQSQATRSGVMQLCQQQHQTQVTCKNLFK